LKAAFVVEINAEKGTIGQPNERQKKLPPGGTGAAVVISWDDAIHPVIVPICVSFQSTAASLFHHGMALLFSMTKQSSSRLRSLNSADGIADAHVDVLITLDRTWPISHDTMRSAR
jgi:hypothetical protein